MPNLTYLMDEICVGLEIYFTSRTGGQYRKTAFILCDDYTELASKLYLLRDDPNWSDTNEHGRFKRYHEILEDVRQVIEENQHDSLPQILEIHERMQSRRNRRNDFFHSTSLLDLNVHVRMCNQGFQDLLEYGQILFGDEWGRELKSLRNLRTWVVLLNIEEKSFNDPAIIHQLNEILNNWPCTNWPYVKPKAPLGRYLVVHPEDWHLRVCVLHGGAVFRQKIEELL